MFERMARNNKLELTKANASANRSVCYSSASESFSQSVSRSAAVVPLVFHFPLKPDSFGISL